MVSVTSASRYHPRYQIRSSMHIHGLIPRNFAELAEVHVVPIAVKSEVAKSNGSEGGAVTRKYHYMNFESRSHKRVSICLYIM